MRRPTTVLLVTAALAATAFAPTASLPMLEACGPGMLLVRPAVGDPLCTHGDDPHLAPGAGAAGGNRADGPVPTAPVRCSGDGSDGPRVEVLGLRVAGRSGPPVRHVRRWIGQVEWTVAASAAQWDAERRVRWVTERGADGGCRVVVRDVAITAAEMTDFGRMVSALRRRDFDRSDRKYLIFAADDSYCGLASAPRDDRADASNRANVRTGYARIDRPCWDGGDMGFSSVAAHELLHTLGAVQDSAPNAQGTAHCRDEWDALCYADGGGTMEVACSDDRSRTSGAGDHFNRLLDCNGDDYFRPDPPAGTYLATHWNVADSWFLVGGAEPTTSETPSSGSRSAGSGRGGSTSRCAVAGVVVPPVACSTSRG